MKRTLDRLQGEYGRQIDSDYRTNFAMSFADTDPALLLEAVEAHIQDTTVVAGRVLGAFAPKTAEIRGKLKDAEARRRRIEQHQAEEAQRVAAAQQGDLPLAPDEEWFTVPLSPDAQAFYGRKELRIKRKKKGYSACRYCADSGWAWFAYDPHDRRRVWLPDQYNALGEAQKAALNRHSALCLCPAYERVKEDYRTALLGDVERGPMLTNLKKISRLARQREQAEQMVIGL